MCIFNLKLLAAASFSRLLNSNTAGGGWGGAAKRWAPPDRFGPPSVVQKVFLYRFILNTVDGPKRSAYFICDYLILILRAAGSGQSGETMGSARSFRAAQCAEGFFVQILFKYC